MLLLIVRAFAAISAKEKTKTSTGHAFRSLPDGVLAPAVLGQKKGSVSLCEAPEEPGLAGRWSGNKKGVRPHLCEAPGGPFRQMGSDPFFVFLATTASRPLPFFLGEKLPGISPLVAETDRRLMDELKARAEQSRPTAVGWLALGRTTAP
jgi:hypothetical protein